MPFGASWQPPRKMSKKCLVNVLVLVLALETCPKNIKKMSPRHFPDIFWQIERWRPSAATQKGARARARFARAKNVKKMSGKCLWTFLGHFFDIF